MASLENKEIQIWHTAIAVTWVLPARQTTVGVLHCPQPAAQRCSADRGRIQSHSSDMSLSGWTCSLCHPWEHPPCCAPQQPGPLTLPYPPAQDPSARAAVAALSQSCSGGEGREGLEVVRKPHRHDQPTSLPFPTHHSLAIIYNLPATS